MNSKQNRNVKREAGIESHLHPVHTFFSMVPFLWNLCYGPGQMRRSPPDSGTRATRVTGRAFKVRRRARRRATRWSLLHGPGAPSHWHRDRHVTAASARGQPGPGRARASSGLGVRRRVTSRFPAGPGGPAACRGVPGQHSFANALPVSLRVRGGSEPQAESP